VSAPRWEIGPDRHDFGERGLIMGVVNVTPDSFSDGGQFFRRERAIEHALKLAGEGADIIDIGGESTRPGAAPVSAEEELRRVLPVIATVRTRSSVVISVDTSKAAVAAAAIGAGAAIVNDVTGGRADPEMMPLIAERGVGFIIMHMQGTPRTMQLAPRYEDVVREVAEFFRQQYGRAVRCGIDPMTMAFDPGIGFGKTLEHNVALLRNLPALRIEDRPLVVGVSRKSFLTKLAGAEQPAERDAPTVAFTALLRSRGADVLRVHRVKENVAALRVADAFTRQAA
jgi:dihydropteroate synthase